MCKVQDQQQVDRKYELQVKEASSTSESRTNSTSISNVGDANKCINVPDFFRSNTNKELYKRENRLLTMKICNDFSDIFTGNDCFKGTFKLQVSEGSHTYQALLRKVAYAPQKELDRQQKW